jgi:hypothetical protein
LPPWWYGYVAGGVPQLDVMHPVAVVLLSNATRLVVWGWRAGTKNSPQASQPGTHNTEHRNNTTLFGLTNPALQDSSDWAARLLPSPNLTLPSLLSQVLWSNLYPVSKHHPRLFFHFLSSPVQTTDRRLHDQLVVSYPSCPQPYSYPPQFSPLHLISLQILFTSLTLPKCVPVPPLHSSLYTVTSSIAYPVFLLDNTLFFHRAYWRLHRCGGLWRKEASASRRWYLYTNQHGITVICFPLLYSTQDQLYGITRPISALHSGVWQAGCEARHTFCAEVKSEWSCTTLPHTLPQHNSKLSKGTMLPLNSSQNSWLDIVIKRQLAKWLKLLPYKNIFIYYIHKYISLTSSL